jgi:hypothetical protein
MTVPSGDPARRAVDEPLPGLPGGTRMRLGLVAVLTGVVGIDAVWLHGAIFGSVAWRCILWGLIVAGLAAGAAARRRRGG